MARLAACIRDIPDELLVNVFRQVAKGSYEDAAQYRWLPVSWVCRWWRTVACDTATLWSCIWIRSTTDPGLVDTALKRSGETLLTVDCILGWFGGSDSNAAFNHLTTVLQVAAARISSLNINFMKYDRSRVEALLSSYAFNLRQLRVSGLLDPADHGILLPFDSASLQELRLMFLGWNWKDVQKFTSLRHLEIHQGDMRSSRHNISEVIQTLQAIPLLTHLHLCFYWSNAALRQDCRLHLSRLQSLQLGYDAGKCASLLGLISFPPEASLSLLVQEWNNVAGSISNDINLWTATDYAAYWSPIASKISQITRPLRSVVFWVHGQVVVCRAWDRVLERRDWQYDNVPSSVDAGPPALDVRMLQLEHTLLEDSFTSLPLAHAESVWIRDGVRHSQQFHTAVRTILTRMPYVAHLDLARCALFLIHDLLSCDVGQSEFWLPSLDVLDLEEVRVTAGAADEDCWHHLSQMLWARRAFRPVRRLGLRGLHLSVLLDVHKLLQGSVDTLS